MIFAIIAIGVGAFVFGFWCYRISDSIGLQSPRPPRATGLTQSFRRAQDSDDAMLRQGWYVRDAGEEGRQLGYWGEG